MRLTFHELARLTRVQARLRARLDDAAVVAVVPAGPHADRCALVIASRRTDRVIEIPFDARGRSADDLGRDLEAQVQAWLRVA